MSLVAPGYAFVKRIVSDSSSEAAWASSLLIAAFLGGDAERCSDSIPLRASCGWSVSEPSELHVSLLCPCADFGTLRRRVRAGFLGCSVGKWSLSALIVRV